MERSQAEILERITIDPDVLVGKPTIRGLRISVEQILRALSAGVSGEELLRDYPELENDDIRAVLVYAPRSRILDKRNARSWDACMFRLEGIDVFCREHGIGLLALFGSQVDGKHDPTSGPEFLVAAPLERCWQWLFHAEAASLRFAAGCEDVAQEKRPIVLGRSRFPNSGAVTLETSSIPGGRSDRDRPATRVRGRAVDPRRPTGPRREPRSKDEEQGGRPPARGLPVGPRGGDHRLSAYGDRAAVPLRPRVRSLARQYAPDLGGDHRAHRRGGDCEPAIIKGSGHGGPPHPDRRTLRRDHEFGGEHATAARRGRPRRVLA